MSSANGFQPAGLTGASVSEFVEVGFERGVTGGTGLTPTGIFPDEDEHCIGVSDWPDGARTGRLPIVGKVRSLPAEFPFGRCLGLTDVPDDDSRRGVMRSTRGVVTWKARRRRTLLTPQTFTLLVCFAELSRWMPHDLPLLARICHY